MFYFKRYLLNNISKLNYISRHNKSTIYALSSGYGKCGVAVIRLSGPQSGEALKAMTKVQTLPKPRMALLKKIYHPKSNELIDKSLVLWFPGPNSFTGEDCCEYQVHGGKAVISAIFEALSSLPYLKPAEPGEFTRRAFDNGKMDLTEVEAFADLLDAETNMQLRQALLQVEGSLKKLYEKWRLILINFVAKIETFIDFEESELLDSNLLSNILNEVTILRDEIIKHLNDGRKGELLRNGIKTIIIGEPNVGKSSLMNIICQRPAAIVSPFEGTTRDVLQATLDINGYPIVLLDTAGLRKTTSDLIEEEGIRRAIDSYQTADLIIYVVDINKMLSQQNLEFSAYFKNYKNQLGLTNSDLFNRNYIIVANKCDLVTDQNVLDKFRNTPFLVPISCTTENGIDVLLKKLTENLKQLCGTPNRENPLIHKERHRYLLQTCVKYLNSFIVDAESENMDIVIMAEYLKLALRQFSKLTGKVTTEDVLDVIFKEFCIGK